MTKRYFPIKTATSCQLKWNWSTLYLNGGDTASCHRTTFSKLTPENFNNFHNLPEKIADRESMLDGKWPSPNCSYCKDIEDQNGVSDRIRQFSVPDLVPPELEQDPSATTVTPQILEVYFNNSCNLGCLYCSPYLSSTIEKENIKHGEFKQEGIHLYQTTTIERKAKNFIPLFWDWFPEGFPKLKRLQIAGGEPLLQKESNKLLDMIEQYPNKNCEVSVITNLMYPKEILENYISKVKTLIANRKIKRFDITCSIDCWGPEGQYVRHGLDLERWQSNFERLLKEPWLTININQTVSVLTVKTMPALLKKLKEWRKQHAIGQWFSEVSPGPEYMKLKMFGNQGEFDQAIKEIAELLPKETEQDKLSFDYMKDIFASAMTHELDQKQINNLIVYLNEKDRRRNTNWRLLFPWLEKYEKAKY